MELGRQGSCSPPALDAESQPLETSHSSETGLLKNRPIDWTDWTGSRPSYDSGRGAERGIVSGETQTLLRDLWSSYGLAVFVTSVALSADISFPEVTEVALGIVSRSMLSGF